MTVPPKPKGYAPDKAPAFVELKLSSYKTAAGALWWPIRPIISPRLQLVHTNGATGEGSIESAINWGNAAPGANTHPHYQVDRHRAAKLVPTDRKGIGNATALGAQGDYGNVSDWSIVIETAANIDTLIVGTGMEVWLPPSWLRDRLRKVGITIDAMQTGPAIRTYNIMIGERRRVAAALIAVP